MRDFKGKISFMGESKSYAYIPEHPILYDELTLWEHMEFAASVYELDRTVFLERAIISCIVSSDERTMSY